MQDTQATVTSFGNHWDSFESGWEAANEIAQRNELHEGELGKEAID